MACGGVRRAMHGHRGRRSRAHSHPGSVRAELRRGAPQRRGQQPGRSVCNLSAAMGESTEWVWFSEGERPSMEELCAMLARGGVEARIVAPESCNTST